MSSRWSAVRLAAAGATARVAYAALTKRQPGGEKTWTRTNHRGEPVTLLEGPAVTLAATAAALVVPGLDRRQRLALALAGAAAGAVGGYDDLAGSGDRRGFRGHLGALAKGEVTTGAVKIAGIGAAGLAAAVLLDRGAEPDPSRGGTSLPGRAADLMINAALVAGTANLMNLFDLRPGRAIKASLITGTALAASGQQARAALAAPAGAALALLPEDLGEQAMLGDCGANAIGAMLGVAAASGLRRPSRLVALGLVAGLTAASEKVSFTKVIERTPPLRWLDQFGRRGPVPGSAASDQAAGPASQPEGGVPLRHAGAGDQMAGPAPAP